MIKVFSITLLLFLLRASPLHAEFSAPVVGVFSQPRQHSNNSSTPEYYIAASYIKWLEAAGAQSIVIPYDAKPALLDELFDQINGLLLPGGEATMSPAIMYMLGKAEQSNRLGLYFPVWGTCLGFEFLLEYVGGSDVLEVDTFEAENQSLPLYQVRQRQLYVDSEIYEIVTRRNVTLNNHRNGIDPDRFLQNGNLTDWWDITSVNVDANGRPFVSTIEPKLSQNAIPFYGVQYHPEKNTFEYATYPDTNIPYEAIDHSPEGIQFSLYMASKFVALTRRNLHTYNGKYPFVYTYPIKVGVSFEQIYILPGAAAWEENATVTIGASDMRYLRRGA